jgi:hypothetical protein
MRFYHLPSPIVSRLRHSTELMWTLKKGIVVDDILSTLPASVREDTMMYLYQRLVQSCR